MHAGQVTSAPYPLSLIDNEGKPHEYQVTPLTDRDFDALDGWIQTRVIAVARASLRDDPLVTEEQYVLEIKAAQKAATGMSLYEDAGADTINTPIGVARLAWQMTRREHPKLEPDHFSRYCREGENYGEILRVFKLQNMKNIKDKDDDKDPKKDSKDGTGETDESKNLSEQ